MNMDLSNKMLKTGTTTLGIVTKDGIILAADKQGSYGGGSGVAYIAGEMKKIHRFNDDIVMTIAGAASLALRAIQNAKAHIKMKDLRERKKSTMKEISSLFSHIALQSLQAGGAVGFLLAGKEKGKTLLYEITGDGIVKEIEDYIIDGSGMMHVNAILDTEYKKDMTFEEGIKLAKRCIIGAAGRDPATGIGYEVWRVSPEKIEKLDDKIWEMN